MLRFLRCANTNLFHLVENLWPAVIELLRPEGRRALEGCGLGRDACYVRELRDLSGGGGIRLLFGMRRDEYLVG